MYKPGRETEMLKHVLIGAAAGAIGTVGLNMATYLDMTLRGRPSSEVPARVAEKITENAGVSLLEAGAEDAEQKEKNRLQGLGALMGFGIGIGIGAAYGLVHGLLDEAPLPIVSAALGGAAMAASDVPATKLGVTNPAEWEPES